MCLVCYNAAADLPEMAGLQALLDNGRRLALSNGFEGALALSIMKLARESHERGANDMLNIERILAILSFGLACLGIGFALGLALAN